MAKVFIGDQKAYDQYLLTIVPAEELTEIKSKLSIDLPTHDSVVLREIELRTIPLFLDYLTHMSETCPLPDPQKYLNDYPSFFAAIEKHKLVFRCRFEKLFPPEKPNLDIDFKNIDDIERLQKALSDYRVKLADYRLSFLIHSKYKKALDKVLEEYVRATIPNVLTTEIDYFLQSNMLLAAYENLL